MNDFQTNERILFGYVFPCTNIFCLPSRWSHWTRSWWISRVCVVSWPETEYGQCGRSIERKREREKKKSKVDVFFFLSRPRRFSFLMHEWRHTASVVLVHNDQPWASVVRVDDRNLRDYTDRQGHHAYCTDRHSSSVVVAFVDVHKANHTDEILRSCNYFACSDMIDRDRRRRRRYWSNRYFDLTTSLDNHDDYCRKAKQTFLFVWN